MPAPPSPSRPHPRPRARSLRALGLAIALLPAAASSPACTPAQRPPAAPSAERAVTGKPEFDRFFADIDAAWRALEAAQRELPESRAALARRLGLPEDAPFDVLGARLRERTARLAQDSLTLELEFTGIEVDPTEDSSGSEADADSPSTGAIPSRPPVTPTATLRTPGREPEPRELRVLEVIAQAALSAALSYAEMSSVQRRIQPLRDSAAALRVQLGAAFPDGSQRARVARDLSEAEALLAQLQESARSTGNTADTLISILDEAANTVSAGTRRRPLREAPLRDPLARPPSSSPPSERPARPAAPRPAAPAESPRDFEP